ncbi:MAG: 16S rRNA (cytidine(1402)-2'-O)-methyltransferase [Vicinamibacterales bacterium]|nr:16S rRNA (cytidine(1402)-2'-O)-methyltransferase [Vicinamibacterales bacterium]
MPGTLYVVATPIGNLEDLSHRAHRILGSVALIAAEDTRRTRKLLTHYGIATPLVSFHAHSGPGRMDELVGRLMAGADVALVSDAGMPTVSDPGAELVAAARTSGVPVDVIPGPSALTTAIAAAGFLADRIIFIGFAPKRPSDRRAALARSSLPGCSIVVFESPFRINGLISDIFTELGNRHICVARELTKVHQEVVVGEAEVLSGREFREKGEFTVVIAPPAETREARILPDAAGLAAEFDELTKDRGFTRRSAVSALARRYGVPSREMYSRIEEATKSGE